jgi:Flp pilus assembly protein TadG
MLVQIFFIMFLLIGVAAIYVDMGLARLTQSQMQNVADASALEGLRQRDALSDNDRRDAAAALVSGANAGPYVAFSGPGLPEGDLNASQTIDPAAFGFYAPALQPNVTDNDESGDMVSGSYSYAPHASEASDYSRADFVVAPAGDPSATSTDTSFLVRLRRTDHRNDAVDRNAGISSSGESLPLLFGRGNVIEPHNGVNDYNPRVHGITVRAASIADARTAMRVGSADVAQNLPGATSASLNLACWSMLQVGIPADPNVLCAGTNPILSSPGKTVGAAVTAGGSLSDTSSGYLPMFDSGTNRVIGFGSVAVNTGMVTRSPNGILAGVNATAVVTDGLSISGLTLLTAAQGALLVPALVR